MHRTLETFANAHRLDAVSRISLELVVEELFTNMIKHSRGPGTTVQIQVEMTHGQLKVEMTEPDVDEFNPFLNIPAFDDTRIHSGVTGGRGLFLVREIAKEVSYKYSNRTGKTMVVIEARKIDV